MIITPMKMAMHTSKRVKAAREGETRRRLDGGEIEPRMDPDGRGFTEGRPSTVFPNLCPAGFIGG
jgi:hypothetical protein